MSNLCYNGSKYLAGEAKKDNVIRLSFHFLRSTTKKQYEEKANPNAYRANYARGNR